jgi:hypothetical protein
MLLKKENIGYGYGKGKQNINHFLLTDDQWMSWKVQSMLIFFERYMDGVWIEFGFIKYLYRNI